MTVDEASYVAVLEIKFRNVSIEKSVLTIVFESLALEVDVLMLKTVSNRVEVDKTTLVWVLVDVLVCDDLLISTITVVVVSVLVLIFKCLITSVVVITLVFVLVAVIVSINVFGDSALVVISFVTLVENIVDVFSTDRMLCFADIVDSVAVRVRVETSVLISVLLVMTLSKVVVSNMLSSFNVVVHTRMFVEGSVTIKVKVDSKTSELVVEMTDVIIADSVAVRVDTCVV